MKTYDKIQEIISNILGFPLKIKHIKEFLWAWKLTGTKPYKIEMNEDNNPSFTFYKKTISCWCSPNKEGKYNIGFFDGSAIFNEKKYYCR
jgi:prepilin-type processing-associated H-X9-DG protein